MDNVAKFLKTAFIEKVTLDEPMTDKEIEVRIGHLTEQVLRFNAEMNAMQAKCDEVYPAFLKQKAIDVAAFAAQKDAEWEASSGPAKVKELQAGIDAANAEIEKLKGPGLKE